ncbi:MAG: nicotinate phosphoribosyltransferase [Myxococcaceae bacterium]|nr:nicotinate phosphoribosyltransferase [Myxococcaceae bacterium]MBH2005765.1 nicotinate phosphoribosyltransferase [Myxococcaceae bacterium]
MMTDYYQITMAYAHWKQNRHKTLARCQLFYRKPPAGEKSIVACGLDTAIQFLEAFRWSEADLAFLQANHFEPEFINHLRTLRFTGSLYAVREGERCDPWEPILQLEAPIVEAQLLETPLLNLINFQSLIATKAHRICQAAQTDPVYEFGLRRAQGPNGALLASRASYIGGCAGTSNFEAAVQFGIPPRGTMSHAWVMAYERESESFEAYCQVYPDHTILAVDTYDTLRGVQAAILLGKKLKGIRLDSGDLLHLSREARKMLDEAGLYETQIIASGDLDEKAIAHLKQNQAPIDAWGVGTRLVTAFDEPALTGVYKLIAVQREDGIWRDCQKISNDLGKRSPNARWRESLKLMPIFDQGRCCYQRPNLHEIRSYAHQAS